MTTATRLARIVWWSITAVTLTLLIGYASLPAVVRYLLTEALETRGLSDVNVIIDRPGWKSWHVPLLSFTYSDTPFPLDVKLEQSEVRYSFTWLREGLVDEVSIGPSHITWKTATPDAKDQPKGNPDIREHPQEEKTEKPMFGFPGFFFPVSTLTIQDLRVDHSQNFNSANHTIVQGTIQNRGGSLSGLLRFRNENIPSYVAQFDMNQTGTISAVVGQDQTTEHPALTLTTHILPPTVGNLLHEGGIQIDLESLVTLAATLVPLPHEFHHLTGTITADWKGTLPLPQTDSTSLFVEGNFSLAWHLPAFSPQIKNLHTLSNGTFTWKDNVLSLLLAPATKGTLDWPSDPAPFSFFTQHPDRHLPRSWQWHISQPMGLDISFAREYPALEIKSGQIILAMSNRLEDLTVTLDLASLEWDTQSGLSGNGSIYTAGHWGALNQKTFRFDDLTWKVKGDLAYTPDTLQVRVLSGTRLASKRIHASPLDISNVEGLVKETISWQTELPSLNWNIQPFQWDFRFHTLSLKNLAPWNINNLSLQISTLRKDGPEWKIEGRAHIKEFGLSLQEYALPKINAIFDFSGTPQGITTHYALRGLPAIFNLKGKLQVFPGMKGGHGTLVLSPLTFQPGQSTLRSMVRPWPWPFFDMTSGTVSSSLELTWSQEKSRSTFPVHLERLQGFFRLDDVGGFLKTTIFKGLDGHLALLGDQDSIRVSPSPVRLEHLQAAIPFTNSSAILSGSLSFHDRPPSLTVQQGATHLLGGRVTAAPVTVDTAQTSHEFLLTVEDLRLKHILELEQQDSIGGTGLLNGSLPVTVALPAIEIQNGRLKARPPGGTLHFDLSRTDEHSWVKSQPNMDILIKSLKNFHYHTLDIGLAYEKNGILRLDTRLEGHNPDFKSGRPIHFNLKIEENIPALLKSLELVQGLEDSIQQMITRPKVRRPSEP